MGPLSSYPTITVQKKHENDGRSGVVQHPTRKLFSRGHDTKQCSA